MVMHNALCIVNENRKIDALLYDGMSLDSAFFLAIIRIAPNAPKYLREKAYRGRCPNDSYG